MKLKQVLQDCKRELSDSEFHQAILMLRAIRAFGGMVSLKEFLSADVEAAQRAGLFSMSDSMDYEISEEGLQILEVFDPKPRS